VRLYELVLENGYSMSPFVWRIRYALAHKGIAFESLPLGFTDISKTFDERFKTLPVIEHADTMLGESWDIAEYLYGTRSANENAVRRRMTRASLTGLGGFEVSRTELSAPENEHELTPIVYEVLRPLCADLADDGRLQ
jgi:Glutathione S-transferase, N-terminal domain